MKRYELDNNATAPLAPVVTERLLANVKLPFHNASSIHAEGRRAKAALERARNQVMQTIGVDDGRVVFTSGATEADNLALHCNNQGPLVTSRLEHAAVRDLAENCCKRGRDIQWVRNDMQGRIDLDDLASRLGSAGQVAIMAANNELGNINPIAEVAALCLAAGVPLHVDAVQAIGRIPFKVAPGVTSVALSAHKSGGPIGVGALWVKNPARVTALVHGGHQERGLRPGTEPVWLVDAWCALLEAPRFEAWQALAAVRDALERELVDRCGAIVNGDVANRLPNTCNISIVNRDAEEILMALDLAGVAVSGGSACTAGSIDSSPVVAALGLPYERSRGVIRISLAPHHADLDVSAVVDRFVTALSPRAK